MITVSIATLKWIIAALATITWILWCRWDARNNGGGWIDLTGLIPTFVYLIFWIVWLIIFYVIL
jgi:hypothetical protein